MRGFRGKTLLRDKKVSEEKSLCRKPQTLMDLVIILL